LRAPTAVYLARTYIWNWDNIFQMACEDQRESSQSAAGWRKSSCWRERKGEAYTVGCT